VIADIVFVLCALVSTICAVMLFVGYRRSRTRLLFWSSLCFAGLAINNVLLMIDFVMVAGIDFTLYRSVIALAAVMLLVYGLITESA
jgi:hypothetical protein